MNLFKLFSGKEIISNSSVSAKKQKKLRQIVTVTGMPDFSVRNLPKRETMQTNAKYTNLA
jgi:hypothetical protein